MTLPNGYKRLEYIESSGTQYINLGFPLEIEDIPKLQVTLDSQFLEVQKIMYHVNGNTHAGYYNSVARYAIGGKATYDNSIAADTNRHTFVLDCVNCIGSIDGAETALTIGTTRKLDRFILFGSTPSQLNKSRIYSCQVKYDGALVRNMIPCKNSSGTVGLYDLANGQFYTNAGSGAFIAGPHINFVNFATLKGLTIPEGVVTQIADASGRVIWSSTIKFTINGDTYIADRGMTWAEWFASDYNTTGETAADVQSISANGAAVELSAVIVGGTAYEVGFGPSIVTKTVKIYPTSYELQDEYSIPTLTGDDYCTAVSDNNNSTGIASWSDSREEDYGGDITYTLRCPSVCSRVTSASINASVSLGVRSNIDNGSDGGVSCTITGIIAADGSVVELSDEHSCNDGDNSMALSDTILTQINSHGGVSAFVLDISIAPAECYVGEDSNVEYDNSYLYELSMTITGDFYE